MTTAVPDSRTSTELDSSSTSFSTAPLDDPAFEPEPYISSLLATSNLKTVLKVEATLISEIRNLDGERKALVYDNYSKLIKATRTIGTMRMNMNGEDRGVSGRAGVGDRRSGGLSEDGMRDLGKRVEGVRKLAEELGRGGVEGEGQEERTKAKEEREKRQLVRWVLDGPQRLRKSVDGGQMQEAEAEWKVISGLLDKWEGVQGVQETRKACEEALRAAEAEDEKNGAG
jgi:vacuolar protein sorting-associated protein 51